MKKLLVILLTAALAFAQQPNKSEIVGSGNYYYGTGASFDANEARDRALDELTKQIAVKVESSFEEKLLEKDQKVTENTEKILKTHSAATLRNVREIKRPLSSGQIEVFCFLRKSEVDKIFNERKELIADIVHKAEKSIKEFNPAYALKYYYFAGLLLNSLPDETVVYNGINLTTEIPHRINEIIRKIGFTFENDQMPAENERQITLSVNYDGKPVSLLDFLFWDGTNQIAVLARDGLAAFKLYGASVGFEELRLNIKYAYYECRKEFSVVESLWELVLKPDFRSQKTISLKKKKKPVQPAVEFSTEYDLKLDATDHTAPSERIAQQAGQFLEILESGDLNRLETVYKGDQFFLTKVKDYVRFNHCQALDKRIQADINKTSNGWEMRRIRMLHEYPSIHKQTTEYLVLDFDDKGKLCDLNTSITEYLYKKFVKEAEYGDDWENRQEIIKFLEKYRTAYMTRDIQTVDLMFAEDAIIIVGRKLERKPLSPDMIPDYERTGNQPEYEYLRLKKADFISRQKRIFDLQQDIFLDFASFDMIRKNNDPNVYGIEMRQNYFSTTYSDEGYLFLLIDFTEIDPLIWVRAWQPNSWSEDELIRTSSFRIRR